MIGISLSTKIGKACYIPIGHNNGSCLIKTNVIKKLKAVDGRLEHIGSQKNNSKIILDYAHTPHALEQALKTIKKHFNRKILIVFGCGGERDVKNRSLMGKIAKKYRRKYLKNAPADY